METARSVMEALVQEATGTTVVSLHHDISTAQSSPRGWVPGQARLRRIHRKDMPTRERWGVEDQSTLAWAA